MVFYIFGASFQLGQPINIVILNFLLPWKVAPKKIKSFILNNAKQKTLHFKEVFFIMPAFSLCFSRIGLTPDKHIDIIYLFINHVKRIKQSTITAPLGLAWSENPDKLGSIERSQCLSFLKNSLSPQSLNLPSPTNWYYPVWRKFAPIHRPGYNL